MAPVGHLYIEILRVFSLVVNDPAMQEETACYAPQEQLWVTRTNRAMRTSVGIARPGAAVGRFGVSHYEAVPASQQMFFNNITVSGGPAPVRAYIGKLLPDVLEGRIEPGCVFDRVVGLDEVQTATAPRLGVGAGLVRPARLCASSHPQESASGLQRVVRGGSWHQTATSWRSAFRRPYDPDCRGTSIGFRPALSMDD